MPAGGSSGLAAYENMAAAPLGTAAQPITVRLENQKQNLVASVVRFALGIAIGAFYCVVCW